MHKHQIKRVELGSALWHPGGLGFSIKNLVKTTLITLINEMPTQPHFLGDKTNQISGKHLYNFAVFILWGGW